MSSKKNEVIPKDLIPIGDITKPKGLKGELKVFLYNKNSKTLKKNISVWIELGSNNYQPLVVEYLLSSGKYKIIKFERIDSRNESEGFSNGRIYVSRADFDNAKDLYLVDLIGFMVKDEFGLEYGEVRDIINLPTNDSLIALRQRISQSLRDLRYFNSFKIYFASAMNIVLPITSHRKNFLGF